jgi:hypothetical protein
MRFLHHVYFMNLLSLSTVPIITFCNFEFAENPRSYPTSRCQR